MVRFYRAICAELPMLISASVSHSGDNPGTLYKRWQVGDSMPVSAYSNRGHFGFWLIARRSERDLTLNDLSQLSGISKRQLIRYE